MANGGALYRVLAAATLIALLASGGAADPAAEGLSGEMAVWRAIKDSTDAADYDAYLKRFPDGFHAPLARSRAQRYRHRSETFEAPRAIPEMPQIKTPEKAPAPPSVPAPATVKEVPSVSPPPEPALVKAEPTPSGKADADRPPPPEPVKPKKAEPKPVPTKKPEPKPRPAKKPEPKPVEKPAPQPTPAFKPGTVIEDCAGCPEMVVVPAGRFRMGDLSGAGYDNEKPVLEVTIPRAFAIATTEVTLAQWAIVMGGKVKAGIDPQEPITRVSWQDARLFARRLSARTAKRYRLASEAEWEYVARAGTPTPYWWGKAAGRDHANYGTEGCCGGMTSGKDEWMRAAPVGSFAANGFGVHDMLGNVSEWTLDCYHPSHEDASTDGSPRRSDDCVERVVRGGAWNLPPRALRAAARAATRIEVRSDELGFRVVRELP